jgi:hypothetical protein
VERRLHTPTSTTRTTKAPLELHSPYNQFAQEDAPEESNAKEAGYNHDDYKYTPT